MVVAVADGHGSSRHDRSHIGARLAVQAAATCFGEFAEVLLDASPAESVRLFKEGFGRDVTRRWRSLVAEHDSALEADVSDDVEEVQALLSRYGSTLLVAGVVRELLLLAKLGDGNVVVFDRNEEKGEDVFMANDGFVGGDTYSLCSPEPARLVQSSSRQLSRVRAVTLSTDGLRDAYDKPESFMHLLSVVVRNLDEYGLSNGARPAPEYLDRFSAAGSGDDISLVTLTFAERDAEEDEECEQESLHEGENAAESSSAQPKKKRRLLWPRRSCSDAEGA